MHGKIVAVTGAARGIGLAIARRAAGEGARVALGDLDADAVADAAAALGERATGHAVDVTSASSIAGFVEAAEDAHGYLDVFVANAGIMWVGDYAAEEESVALKQFDVNFHGVARGIRLVAPAMAGRGGGQIAVIASAASRIAPPGEATYAATKHAVAGYCEAVREELHGSGVEISVVMPGLVTTELGAGTSGGSIDPLSPEDVAEAVAAIVARPRPEVTVPRRIATLTRMVHSLPPRARIAISRRLVPDQRKAVQEAGPASREDYERRTLG